MDCAMEQSLKKMAVHMYRVYSMPVVFASHPGGRSVWHAALRMGRVSHCICTHMWDRIVNRP